MKIFRYQSARGPRVGIETEVGRFDAGELAPDVFGSISAWLSQALPLLQTQTVARKLTVFSTIPNDAQLLAPLDGEMEVWASGVTYERSKVARQEESEGGGDFYDKVYNADRPELFFKALPRRVSGPNELIRIRRDSTWDVPEPELTLVLSSRGDIVGVTVGNDVSSRSIEGENPLYLPQAKSYDGACAVGPAIWVNDGSLALDNLLIELRITRGGETVFYDSTSTARMKRKFEELAGWLFRETTFPHGVLLMTGTGIVPPDSFTLQSSDEVTITIDGIGTLTNTVA